LYTENGLPASKRQVSEGAPRLGST
jgi:hypothetical protein